MPSAVTAPMPRTAPAAPPSAGGVIHIASAGHVAATTIGVGILCENDAAEGQRADERENGDEFLTHSFVSFAKMIVKLGVKPVSGKASVETCALLKSATYLRHNLHGNACARMV